MSISKWAAAAAVVAVFAGQASAAQVGAGTVKSINADKKSFVITDSDSKDWTISFADDTVVNRGGKEGKADLKAGDVVHVCFEKGLTTRTAHYILVKEGDAKNSMLMTAKVKSYDKEKKELVVTDDERKDHTYASADAKVRLNKEDSRADEIKIGDTALLILNNEDGKSTLKHVMITRK